MRSVRSVAWVVLLLVASLAIGGLVVALDHPESGDARPELIVDAASVLGPRLAAIEPALAEMDSAAADLGAAGIDALEALRAGLPEALAGALDDADTALAHLADAAAPVRAAAPGLLRGLEDGSLLASSDRERAGAVGRAVAAIDAIDAAWSDALVAIGPPAAMVTVLADHAAALDRATGAGREGRYPEAVSAMAAAAGVLREATRQRDRAAAVGRLSEALDVLLDRLAARDAALAMLYAALAESGGVRTPAAEEALSAAETAGTLLAAAPQDLPTIVEDLGASALIDTLLVIDDGRGAIATALGRP